MEKEKTFDIVYKYYDDISDEKGTFARVLKTDTCYIKGTSIFNAMRNFCKHYNGEIITMDEVLENDRS